VLYVGRLEARKGILEAVEPVVRLLRCMPDLRWRLAGADTLSGPGGGSMKAALEARIPMDLRPRVEFLGSLGRERLAEEFARAGVVLLPSRQENFPYACLEAMAAGAPVVGSKRGGMTEMIADGHNGLLVDPAAPGEIFDALLRILEQPFFADGIGRAARKSVAAHFHPEVIAPLVETHYRHVIAYAQTP
jgi:glycosyltransferase involved in cell wall biosynthesis